MELGGAEYRKQVVKEHNSQPSGTEPLACGVYGGRRLRRDVEHRAIIRHAPACISEMYLQVLSHAQPLTLLSTLFPYDCTISRGTDTR